MTIPPDRTTVSFAKPFTFNELDGVQPIEDCVLETDGVIEESFAPRIWTGRDALDHSRDLRLTSVDLAHRRGYDRFGRSLGAGSAEDDLTGSTPTA